MCKVINIGLKIKELLYTFAVCVKELLHLYLSPSGYGVYAEEDENVDDIVDVEGEEGNVITEEETEETKSNTSSDADTTILFTKPIHNSLSTLGTYKLYIFYNTVY